ncbi:hypothetical protein [Acinetobacter sp. YH12025]|uniref:hypothetical protein n=1 Tax=Acinetobacter sp. YH12025 TaxID=2601042 RepID=UPI00211ED201|nr:hypothetical protein [Acinetobacter sp. YH12025]
MKRSYKLIIAGVILFVVALNLGLLNTSTDTTVVNTKTSADTANSKPVEVISVNSQLIATQTDSRIALKNFLKDPDSAEIRNHNGNCGEVNSKNSFGGYTGFRRFIASSTIVAVEGENMDSDEFQKAWAQVCN